MKIVSWFSDVSEIKPLAKAGADEFYCAVKNIPSFGTAHLSGSKALKAAIDRVHASGRKLALAVNRIEYVLRERECARLMADILEIDRLGIDNFIVANPAFFLMLEDYRARHRVSPPRAGFHLSSVQPCFNHRAVAFLLRFGFSRVILPVQLSALEAGRILELCRSRGVETEIFDYRFFGCVYINGRCHMHTPYFHTFRDGSHGGGLCQAGVTDTRPVELRPFLVARGREGAAASLLERVRSRVRRGGPNRINNAGSFFDSYTAGVQYVKYGTRTDPTELKVAKVGQMRWMIRLIGDLIAEHGEVRGRAQFLARMGHWRWDQLAVR